MVEQVVIHEVTVALVVRPVQAHVFIQVYAVHLAEVESFLFAAARQFPVHAHRAGTGSQTECTGRVVPYDLLDDVRCFPCAVFIVFCDDNLHVHFPLEMIFYFLATIVPLSFQMLFSGIVPRTQEVG